MNLYISDRFELRPVLTGVRGLVTCPVPSLSSQACRPTKAEEARRVDLSGPSPCAAHCTRAHGDLKRLLYLGGFSGLPLPLLPWKYPSAE